MPIGTTVSGNDNAIVSIGNSDSMFPCRNVTSSSQNSKYNSSHSISQYSVQKSTIQFGLGDRNLAVTNESTHDLDVCEMLNDGSRNVYSKRKGDCLFSTALSLANKSMQKRKGN